MEAAWQIAGKSFWTLFLLLPIWNHFFRQSRHWGTSGAHPPPWQACSTSSAWCTHTVGLPACKRLSVLAILATSLHLSKRVLLLVLPKPVQSGRNSTDRRLFFWNKCIATKDFVGNFLQTHSQYYHDVPACCGAATCSNHNAKEPWCQEKVPSALFPSC